MYDAAFIPTQITGPHDPVQTTGSSEFQAGAFPNPKIF